MGKRIGVLVMSYGTPESMDQIEAYYTHIRRGRAPSEEQLQELIERYEAIVGGVFPLRENTNKQVDALQQALNEADHEAEFICVQGLKHAAPFIEDGVQALADQGITEAVGIVLAPHYSVMSVGSYIKRAQAKADELGIAFRFAKCYHTHPDLITAFAERVTETLGKFEGGKDAVRVLFTAHSLPEKILQMGDPYVDQLLETSRLIAEQAGISILAVCMAKCRQHARSLAWTGYFGRHEKLAEGRNRANPGLPDRVCVRPSGNIVRFGY